MHQGLQVMQVFDLEHLASNKPDRPKCFYR